MMIWVEVLIGNFECVKPSRRKSWYERGCFMKPLCTKTYFDKILEIILLLFGFFMDVMFIIYNENDVMWLIVIIGLTVLLVLLAIDIICWMFQPHVLIYQYETGIVIKRNVRIEYTLIERVTYKKYIRKERYGNYYKDTWSGIIYIKLKSGKTHKIRNAYYPIEAVDILSRIKQQKKFR